MNPQTDTADREIVISRTYAAPRELVWRAWSEPERISVWWGPDGFTTTIYEMDFRVGGVWRYMMHGPDGTDYPNRVVYQEIQPYDRITYLHGDDSIEWNPFNSYVTFTEKDGGTELTLRVVFPTVEERRNAEQYGATEGGQQTLACLAEYLATM